MSGITQRIKNNKYVMLGLSTIFLAQISLVFQAQSFLLPTEYSFVWLCLTGLFLLLTLAFQWYLFRKRWIGKLTRFDLDLHRWIGIVATLLFALHAARFGHSWMTALTIVFILTVLTGIFNKEIMRFSQRWMYLVWLALHISLSFILVPLIAVHIWIALAYQ